MKSLSICLPIILQTLLMNHHDGNTYSERNKENIQMSQYKKTNELNVSRWKRTNKQTNKQPTNLKQKIRTMTPFNLHVPNYSTLKYLQQKNKDTGEFLGRIKKKKCSMFSYTFLNLNEKI